MSSFLYLYSKFTEEFLLLSAAALFALLAAYCYQWVIKKRRLGAARNQIPATVVKAYLNQLINEAQFVRTQLFGLMNGIPTEGDPMSLLRMPHSDTKTESSSDAVEKLLANPSAAIPSDLEERLKSLQKQLSEKESIVVNINVEKTKLLEEIENLRQNQKAMQSAGSSGAGSDELAKKVKELEARLEEYSLFEDDLANLKRLQQENQQLKKKLETLGSNLSPAAEATSVSPTPLAAVAAPVPAQEESAPPANTLDQSMIDALLAGTPATPPVTPTPTPTPAPAPVETKTEPAPESNSQKDAFENLVASVETSLSPAPQEAAPANPPTPAPEQANPAQAAPQEANSPQLDSLAAKSDEELLKEFENLLNS
jgi:predicted DNA-binding protein